MSIGGPPGHVLTRRRAISTLAALTCGSGLLGACTSAESSPGDRSLQPLLHPGRPAGAGDGETRNRIDFRDPSTMWLRYSMNIPAAGVNHLDFTADGRYALASCEFSASAVWIDMSARRVVSKLTLGKTMSAPVTPQGPGYSMPQDVRLSADGQIFYVADMAANGVWLIGARQFKRLAFIRTGAGTHGLEIGRDGRHLFISNRGEGSISVLDMASNRVVRK